MASVTKIVNKIKKPGTDYIKISDFSRQKLKDTESLSPIKSENISSSIVGLTVDYLTRFMLSGDVREAFSISLKGAVVCSFYNETNEHVLLCEDLLKKVKGLDKVSIESACKIVTFDIWSRNPAGALLCTKGCEETNPDSRTIDNIRIMVERSLSFFEKYGPVTKFGFDFKPNGYTETITAGEGDYLTKDTLWDFKVSKEHPSCRNALQVLTYWVMGQHSGQEIFKDISQIGIFNPRLNYVYIYKMSWIDKYIIGDVEDCIIGY